MLFQKKVIVVPYEGKIDLERLNKAFESNKFRECGKTDEERVGFFGLDEFDDESPLMLCLAGSRFIAFNIRQDRKKVKKTLLSRAWRRRIAQVEKAEQIKLDQPRRKQLREDVKGELLKEIVPKEDYFKAVFDTEKQRIYILVSLPKSAELVVSLVKGVLSDQGIRIDFSADSMPNPLCETLTGWLAEPATATDSGFVIGETMTLEGEGTELASLKGQEADTAEVKEHLFAGKQVRKIALIHEETQAAFTLTSTKVISQIDLKVLCEEELKEIKQDSENADQVKVAEAQVWLTHLSELVDIVESIPE